MTSALGTKRYPIRCEGPSGERQYLEQITTSKAKTDPTEHIQYRRIGSVRVPGKILDHYEIANMKGTVVADLYFDMYHEGYEELKVPPGFTRLQEADLVGQFGSMAFDCDIRNRLRKQHGEVRIPTDSHGYVEAKAQSLLLCGPQFYALNDFFGYPKPGWKLLELLSASDYLVNKMAGRYAEEPLKFSSVGVLEQFFKTWHFDVVNPEMISAKESVVINAVHEVTGENLFYWCVTKSDM